MGWCVWRWTARAPEARGAPTVARRAWLAAVDYTTGVTRGQVAVDAKSNEITAFVPLLD